MVVGKENIPLKNVRSAYWISGIVALIIGLFLVLQTSLILFYIGFGGMLIGALYTMGPLPINSASFGEFFVGLSMGVGIFTSMVYINAFDIVASIPRLVALSLLTFPYVLKNIGIFMKKQDKKTTFMTTIINSAVIPVPIIITFLIGAWLDIWLSFWPCFRVIKRGRKKSVMRTERCSPSVLITDYFCLKSTKATTNKQENNCCNTVD